MAEPRTAGTGGGSRTIVQYWHAERIPDYLAELVGSFEERNPGWTHRVFSESSAEAFIARHLGPRELAAFRACAVPAMQSDYLRYCAVLTLGGVYCDAGVRCVAPLQPLIDTGGGHVFEYTNGAVMNGFFAFAAPRHPLLRLALDIATANIERRAPGNVHVVTGPVIFSGLRRLHEAGSFEAMRARATRARLEAHVDAAREVIGSWERVAAAFEDVRLHPHEEALEWVRWPDVPLPHRHADRHWASRAGSIFRPPSTGATTARGERPATRCRRK